MLKIFYGPMFAGKSTKLLHVVNEFIDVSHAKGIGKKAIIINSVKDNRNIKKTGNITSHSSMEKKTTKSNIEFLTVEKLSDVKVERYDCIGVDECQFFPDLYETVKIWLDQKKQVNCAGLISDVNKNKFGQLLDLFPHSSDNIQMKAYCLKCEEHYQNATFTKLIKETGEKNTLFVSASEHYIPVCEKHF